LLLFGGRHPLCGIGVTSMISVTSIPALWMDRIADSLPFPGPLTYTFTLRKPASCATFAQSSDANWAAYGVVYLEPRKPILPAEHQAITSPFLMVKERIMILNEPLIGGYTVDSTLNF